uniref:disease resistance protein RUN1-like isoform X2 n=1 Tax=Erigeron canadensis TaxID=72917 RepID=UPI001CB894EA|nr:disease resistance protein RUN1-like isoform X2 [Erigeron canadensis]
MKLSLLLLSIFPFKRQRDEDYSCNDNDNEPFHCSRRPKHDVFLSYSNEDVGNSFVSHLKGALQRYGFDVSDHTSLPVGQDETSSLLKAIEESWIYVVVFSTQYPFSVKCLGELVLIRDSISKFKKRRVFPIFYKVDPSHVRSQRHGCYLQAFQAHHHNHADRVRVKKWKHALEDVSKLVGETFETGENEENFVRRIVKKLGKLKLPVELFDADHAVGIEPRAQDLISELRLDDPDPSVTALLGMSGSGKTTLAKAVYDRIVPDFDAKCFIENTRFYKRNGPKWKHDLQQDVFSQLTEDDDLFHNVLASSNIKKIVSNQKVLLVLDDVDKYEQLQALGVQDPASFGWGSRILVTTTNKQSLCGLRKYTSYDIKLLNESESSKLFTGIAYERSQSNDKKFVDEIVSLAGGVPLVLEVWGHYFKSHERRQWPILLEKLRRIPHEDIQKKLQVSYDSLSPRAKNLFLDIACFFDGMDRDLVIKVLHDEENAFFPDIEIQDLIDKGLVREGEGDDRLTMHVVIRDMGREVVRQENEDDPGQRSRLGTDLVRSIYLDKYDLDEDITIQVEAFRKMSNLMFIKLGDYNDKLQWSSFYFSSIDEIMPPLCFKHLKYLEWEEFPFKCLDKIDMSNAVVIKLHGGNLDTLWEGFKSLMKLRILFVEMNGLNKTGSFIGLENLEKLVVRNSHSLKDLDGSIGCLQKLGTLDLSGCHELKEVPWEMIHKLTSLVKIYLKYCPNILNISNVLWNLPNRLQNSFQLQGISCEIESMGEPALPDFQHIYICFKSYHQKSVQVFWSK